MTTSLILACIWAVIANISAMMPSKDNHRTIAYVLIAIGIPIVGYVTCQHGPGAGLFMMVAGMSILRWPIIYYLTRWLKDKVRR